MSTLTSRIQHEKEQQFSFASHANMEDLLEKLKLLECEKEFLHGLKIKPIHKYYFMVVKNSGEQFYLFSVLASWLIKKSGREFQEPQEYDDPNDTISKILDAVRNTELNVEIAPYKLKQGVGDEVVLILNTLADEAIKNQNFSWDKPRIPKEKDEEVEAIDDESEINLDQIEEEMVAAYSDDSDEENIFHMRDFMSKKEVSTTDSKPNMDEESWKLELERVLPQLKVTIRNTNRDWRTHFEQMREYKINIDQSLGIAKNHLDKIYKEVNVTMEKICNREKYLNRELDSILTEYKILQDDCSKAKERYKNLSGGVAERNRELQKLNDKLETVKQQMEECGSSMTDGSPLVNIKKAVVKIKSEIANMDMRIGVLQCILLQSKISQEKQLETEFGQYVTVF